MNVIRFAVKELAEKVFSEYKLQPRKSRNSNPDAEIYLVRNQGIYCMAGCNNKLSKEKASLVYAFGCNPNVDQDWLEVSRNLAGGDDFCQIIPPIWIERAIVNQQDFLDLQINVSKLTINVVQ